MNVGLLCCKETHFTIAISNIVSSFQTLRGEHLARCVGRLAGKVCSLFADFLDHGVRKIQLLTKSPSCVVQNGKTKFTIENSTRTRIVVADTKIHILGSFQNIKVAR